MSEELRLFLRVALYSVVAGTIYWFVSYEQAGSILFFGVVLGGAFFVAAFARAARTRGTTRAAPDGNAVQKSVARTKDTLGLTETQPEASSPPLELEEEPIAPTSIWPVATSIAALLLALGLVYGAWLWLPGAALAVLGAWGWLTQLRD